MTTIQIGPIQFSAAHFVHLAEKESKCQHLHGHNYFVLCELEGTIQPDGMLVDAHHIKDIIKTLDHKTLIPTKLVNSKTVDIDEGFIRYIEFQNPTNKHTYIMPECDCEILSIQATTAEHLSEWVRQRIHIRYPHLSSVGVRVYETPTLSAHAV